jgi:hypothetical protein
MYGEGLEITNCYRAFAGSGDYLLDSIEVKGTITFDGLGAAGPPLEFQSMGGNELRILQPALHLAMETKKAGPGELVTTFSGSVSNCGNTRLTNVVVFNYLNGVYDYLLGPVSLEAGGKINVALPSKAWSDGRSALLAWGTDELGLTVSNSVTPEPPISLGLIFSGQDMRLIWNSVIDRIYQVQYKTDWLQQDWKNLGGPIQAHGSFASLSDADKTIGQRFYRIVSLP